MVEPPLNRQSREAGYIHVLSDEGCDEACVLNSVASTALEALNTYDCAVITTPISSHTSCSHFHLGCTTW